MASGWRAPDVALSQDACLKVAPFKSIFLTKYVFKGQLAYAHA
jgi:hypothetical protein